MKQTSRTSALRRSLLVNNLSYKLRSHLEFAAGVLIIVVICALALPMSVSSAINTRVSEIHMITRLDEVEAVAYRAQTGRWPAAGAAVATRLPMASQDRPIGTQFQALTRAQGGVLRATPSAALAAAAGLGEQSYWLSPVATAASDSAPIIWVCTQGLAPPTAQALAQRQGEDDHLPPSFCR